VRQIDDVGGCHADLEAIDLALELGRQIVAVVGACRRSARYGQCERGQQRKRGGEQGRSAKSGFQCHDERPFAPLKRPQTVSARVGGFDGEILGPFFRRGRA